MHGSSSSRERAARAGYPLPVAGRPDTGPLRGWCSLRPLNRPRVTIRWSRS